VRRGTRERRIGHTGTLDPLAEGVLVLALGQATRLVEYLSGSAKCYRAGVVLGLSTDTYDVQGQVLSQQEVPPNLSLEQVETALDGLRGEIDQTPPIYSAIKVKGKTAYARARAGEIVALPPRRVSIYELSILSFAPPHVDLFVRCSAGTYIRSLAHDLGQALGCGGTMASLVRTASGAFRLEDATSWEALQASFASDTWQNHLLPASAALPDWVQVVVDENELERLGHGMTIDAPGGSHGMALAYSSEGQIAAVLEADLPGTRWHPKKVFV
jgi:tRNA pseudouridine55 synthase